MVPGQAMAGRDAYEALAPVYDDFTAGYMADKWTAKLLGKARNRGLPDSGRLLDVGCGSGKSFLSMIERNWVVMGCDISPAMIEVARAKVDDTVELTVADMRELPTLGSFDLIWALNDSVNYLLSAVEMEDALSGMRANLAPDGLVVFDVNTLLTYRTSFAEVETRELNGRRMVWSGQANPRIAPGSICEARVDISGDLVESHIHRQRHFSKETVLEVIDAAGLECLDVWGELEGALNQPLDEALHTKAVYISRAAGLSNTAPS